MKTLDQVIRYTRRCKFVSDEDWAKTIEYCKENDIPVSYLRRALKPVDISTFQQFKDWFDNGCGTGDIIGFGRTVGMIKDMLPGRVVLIAFLGYDHRILEQELEIVPEDINKQPNEALVKEFKDELHRKKLTIDQRHAILVKLYTPEKFSYISYEDDNQKTCIGIYSGTVDSEYCFIVLWNGKKILTDCGVQCKNIRVRPSTPSEVKILHQRFLKAGWIYNERTNTLLRRPKRGRNNEYWYLTDKFSIAKDIDNGGRRHEERFKVGNYFTDFTLACDFMKKIVEFALEEPHDKMP